MEIVSSKQQPISLVVTNYKCWPLTKRCVEKHLSLEEIDEVIIVDDCSGEPIPTFSDPRVRVIKNEQNLGFVKSVNVGIRNATSTTVLLFDADAYPLEKYRHIVTQRFVSDPELAMLGFLTFDDNNTQTASYEAEPSIWSLILGQKAYFAIHKPNKANTSNIIVYSCAVALRKDVFLELGGFDENIDWIDPDVEKCISLRKSGWKIDIDNRLKAFHKGGAIPQLTSNRVLKQYLSRWYVLSKHDKIPSKTLSRLLILGRLSLEYILLEVMGRVLYSKEVAIDKVNGRRFLISKCNKNFV